MKSPRSRRDTRAAVLGGLWASRGAFRPQLIEKTDLTPASISRITAELMDEGLIQEERRTAPYQGGPSAFLTLSNDSLVAAFELSGGHLHAAVGCLGGAVRYADRVALPDDAAGAEIDQAMGLAVRRMADWLSAHELIPEQIGLSVPGFHPGQARNPIIAFDPARAEQVLDAAFPGVPVVMANSMVARALAYSLHDDATPAGSPCLFVYAGHGIGAALLPASLDSGEIEPCEIGHMIVARSTLPCRCGHTGCLEPLASTVAVADILGVSEDELIRLGDGWAEALPRSARARGEIRHCLDALGTAIGNTLNVRRLNRVVIAGWPAALPEGESRALTEALDRALFGGARTVEVRFAPSNLGREPVSGLALAVHAFIRRGGERRMPLKKRAS